MRLDFVINGNAGRVDAQRIPGELRKRFVNRDITLNGDFESIPKPPSSGRSVIAVGGDGTVSHVLNAMGEADIHFGVLPLGTANDFAAELGIPHDFAGACDVIERDRFRPIDLIRVNAWRVATCGGIGFATDVALQANGWKSSRWQALVSMLGPLVYPLATLRRLASGGVPIRAKVSGHGIREEVVLSTAMVSNQAKFGGRFSTSPQACNTDGKLDLCLIEQAKGAFGLTRIAARIYQGEPQLCPETRQIQTQSVTLTTDRAVPFFADGELLGFSSNYEMWTEPGALQVSV